MSTSEYHSDGRVLTVGAADHKGNSDNILMSSHHGVLYLH